MKCRILSILLAGPVILQLGCGGGGGGVRGGGAGGAGGGTGGAGDNLPTCSAFTACGGDLTGKWSIDSVCLEGDLNTALAEIVGEMPSACKDFVQSVSVQMSGTVEFAEGSEISDTTTDMSLKVKYSKACVEAASSTSVSLNASVCSALATAMNSEMDEDGTDGSVTCSYSGNACNCTIGQSKHNTGTTAYQVQGNTFTDDTDTVQFCVSGDTLTTRAQAGEGFSGQTKLHRI